MNSTILVAQGVQDQEFWYPYYRLQELGNVLVVAKSNTEEFKGKYGIPIKTTTTVESYLEDLKKTRQYPDVLIIPGGWQCPEILRVSPEVLEIIKILYNISVIGAICHGPQVLISAGLCQGKNMTAYSGIKDDLINAGAIWYDKPVVRDGKIVTAQHYKDNPEFMKEILSGF